LVNSSCCSKCSGTGVHKVGRTVTCNQCSGARLIINDCRKCSGLGRNKPTCKKCDGTGRYYKIT
jgi:DnaJ-class molecular chaperone